MTRADIRDAVMRALEHVAPEIDPQTLRDDVPLRQQAELDSMDFLRFVIGLHELTGVEVPEADYQRLRTVADAVDYIAGRSASSGARTIAPCRS